MNKLDISRHLAAYLANKQHTDAAMIAALSDAYTEGWRDRTKAVAVMGGESRRGVSKSCDAMIAAKRIKVAERMATFGAMLDSGIGYREMAKYYGITIPSLHRKVLRYRKAQEEGNHG